MIEEVKTNIFYLTKLWFMHRFTARWLDLRHNTHRLLLFVLLCLQQF